MKKFRENMLYTRILNLVFVFIIIFSLLIFRLYCLQIKNHDELKLQALMQRGVEIDINPNRGIIYDRNLIPITNREKSLIAFVFKDTIEQDEKLKKYILDNSSLDEKELREYLKDKKDLVAIPLRSDALKIENNKDIYIAEKTFRYSNENTLSHVIGYINKSENRGETGIEKLYDEILKFKDYCSLFLEFDNKRNIIFGGEYSVGADTDPYNPDGVKLTVDYNLQKIVENIFDEEKLNGAAIVTDVDTGDILAMVSRPNFNQEDIDEYFDREDMALYNKAIQVAYPPGSLFKIVVLLTALEENMNIQDELFYCRGYEKINDIAIKCNNIYGHGYLTLKEGFSKSCNSVFIQLGQELGSKKIMDMSRRLGFGDKINIGLLEEVSGNLPVGKDLQGPAIGNISIGQGSIETTPLQITNMMMIIANNGIKKDIRIVDGIVTRDGYMIKKYNREEDKRVLSEEICQILQEYLVDVVENGTAKKLDLKDIGGGGGKTGSAQAVLNRRKTIHAWFSGFYPEKKPKYVITVFIEEGKSGAGVAAPVFEKISKEIYRINR